MTVESLGPRRYRVRWREWVVVEGTPPPTLDEVDACIRNSSSRAFVAQAATMMMRFTGLRVAQVLGVRC